MIVNVTLEEAYARASAALRRKMEYSVNLLRKAERMALAYDSRGGYYLAFSGGKDSQALLHIAQLAGVRYEGFMSLTSVDPPEVIRFVKRQYPEVTLIKPKASIYQIAVQKNLLPTQRVRWCCNEYKENAGAGRVTLIGIRHQESTRRAKRNEVEISSRKFSGTLEGFEEYREEKLKRPKRANQKRPSAGSGTVSVNITNATAERTVGCISGKESLLISPIIHWTERDVWEFLNRVVMVPHCELYDQGWRRIGCIGCPMSSYRHKLMENRRWPHVRQHWIKAIIAIRNGGGISKRTYDSQPCGTVLGRTGSRYHSGKTIDDYGYIPHPDPEHWGGRKPTDIGGFSEGSSSDGLTDEQTLEIAENIYDWWISGKSYKRWYADRFLQLKIPFE